MHLGATVATLAAMTWIARPALADESADIDLRWHAPSECPEEAYVRAAVERLAARPLATPGGRWVPVRIEAAPEARGWAVRIAIGNLADGAPPHERRIEGRTCAEVADAAAVAVAIAIVPAPSPPPPPAPPAAPEPVAPAGADRVELPPAAPTTRLRPSLRVAGGADFASLPAPSFGGEVAVALGFGADRVDVHASAWLPEEAAVAADAMASGRIWLVAAGARYCRALLQRAVELDGCAGLEAGALLGRSYGVTQPASGASPWVAPALGAAAVWHLGRRLSMRLALEGLAPLERKTFEIDGLGAIFRPPPVTGRTLLGLDLHLE